MGREFIFSVRGVVLIIGAMFVLGCQSFAGSDVPSVSRPEEFGAIGDGVSDDTNAVQRAISAADDGILEFAADRIYLISRGLQVRQPIHVRGGGVLQAVPDIEAHIGTRGNDSLIRFTETARGSTIDGLIVDLGGSGRNAVDVSASDMRIENVLVRNYDKDVKADGRNHRESESGLRIRGSGSVVNGLRCEDMTMGVQDAVPRCVTVQGGARNIVLRNITGVNITGGIVVGKSHNLRIDGYDFRLFSDNGIYFLPGAEDSIATNGYLENGREPVVFKGDQRTRVSGLRIHNMGMSFGLENTSDVILEDVDISYDNTLSSRPAFARSRPKNTLSRNVNIRRVNASMPFGDSLFSLGYGALQNVVVSESRFLLDVPVDNGASLRLVRQRHGQPLRLVDTDINFAGAGGRNIERAIIFVPSGFDADRDEICENCRFRSNDKIVSIRTRSRGP